LPSLQFHLFKPLMRIARWSQGNFPVQDASAFVRFRQLADRMANFAMRPPRDVKVESESVGGVAGDWLIPANAPENPVMLFLHGGGIAFGWNNPLRRELAYLAKFAGLRAFGVDYHLIPEYLYPVAHDECYAVYRALLQQGKQIVMIGESSGALLALAILLRAKAVGLSQPLLCALISPVVDYGFKDARVWQSDDPFAHPRFTVEMHKHYVAGNDTMLPDLSPVHADLSGIAPLYVIAGENEIMHSEVDRLAQAAQRYNVPMEILLCPHVWHSWHALAPQLPEATRALKTLGAAIRWRVSKYG
jgi:monoterpene epsilon-lactone hydrolase